MDSKTRREVVATLIKAGRRDLANQFVVKALWMPTAEIKKLIGYSSAISSATRAVDASLNRLLDDLQGGIDESNMKRIKRVNKQAIDALKELYRAVGVADSLLQYVATKLK